MKIIKLTAENVKRLRAVEIEPDGTVQIVTGRNAQGKTSVLDAIWLALGGGAASRETPRPVRDGEDYAEVTVDMGDLIVTRTWEKGKASTLVVKAPDGARYPTPQTILDGLVGKLSFDPLAFTHLSPREQRAALLDLLGLDFEAEDAERARLYALRTETGRKAHAYGELPRLDKHANLTEQSVASTVERIRHAQRQQASIDSYRREVAQCLREVEQHESEIERLQALVRDGRARIADLTTLIDGLPTPEDTEALNDELLAIEERNRQARANQELADKHQQQKAYQAEYTDLTHTIEAIDAKKAKALAEAKMPVPGLGFDDNGVTLHGVPFGQASSSEQIRVSLGMAMALNPTLRVVRIVDGSLLDADGMAEIAAMARAADYQVWIERVEDASETAVVIEDGQVAR